MSDKIEGDYDTGFREGYEAASGAARAEIERLTEENHELRSQVDAYSQAAGADGRTIERMRSALAQAGIIDYGTWFGRSKST